MYGLIALSGSQLVQINVSLSIAPQRKISVPPLVRVARSKLYGTHSQTAAATADNATVNSMRRN